MFNLSNFRASDIKNDVLAGAVVLISLITQHGYE